MNKILIVLMFIFLGTSILIVSSMGKEVENSFTIEYHNNKNVAMPDLTGKTEMYDGWYQIQKGANYDRRYNIYTGEWYMDGVFPSLYAGSEMILFEIDIPDDYVLTPVLISGSHNNTHDFIFRTVTQGYVYLNSGQTMNINNSSTLQWRSNVDGLIYNHAIIKLQLEKGSQATSYVVPKLIPIYKDNLTQQEKQEIGFGAFGGLSQIIRSVDNVIKPIGNFINGVLNLFK